MKSFAFLNLMRGDRLNIVGLEQSVVVEVVTRGPNPIVVVIEGGNRIGEQRWMLLGTVVADDWRPLFKNGEITVDGRAIVTCTLRYITFEERLPGDQIVVTDFQVTTDTRSESSIPLV